MFEEATTFHQRLVACHKYAVMQRDGAAGNTSPKALPPLCPQGALLRPQRLPFWPAGGVLPVWRNGAAVDGVEG